MIDKEKDRKVRKWNTFIYREKQRETEKDYRVANMREKETEREREAH